MNHVKSIHFVFVFLYSDFYQHHLPSQAHCGCKQITSSSPGRSGQVRSHCSAQVGIYIYIYIYIYISWFRLNT